MQSSMLIVVVGFGEARLAFVHVNGGLGQNPIFKLIQDCAAIDDDDVLHLSELQQDS